MYIKKFMIFMALLIFILSCTDSTEPEKNSYIKGIVVDSLERPVAGVKIFPEYYFDPPIPGRLEKEKFVSIEKGDPGSSPIDPTEILGNYPNPFTQSTTTSFNIGVPDSMKLYITDQFGVVEKTLIETFLPSGHYSYAWDGKNDNDKLVENGVYTLHLTSDTLHCSHVFFKNSSYEPPLQPENYCDYIITNEEGKFEINQSKFPLGDSLQYVDIHGEPISNGQVTRCVKFWALKQGYPATYVDSVYVDEQEGCYIQIQLNE